MHKISRHPQLYNCHRPFHPPEMDRDRTIHGYTYRPAYRNPYNQHHHMDYISGTGPTSAHREVILILLLVIAAPLILGASIEIGLAATAIYGVIQRRLTGRKEIPDGRISDDAAPPEENHTAPPHSHSDNPDNRIHPNEIPARMRWGKDSAGSLRFIQYRAIASRDHQRVKLVPPHLELGPVGGDTPAPSLPT